MKKLKLNQQLLRNGTTSERWKVDQVISPLWPPVELYFLSPDPVVKGGALPTVVTSKNWNKFFQELPSKGGDTSNNPKEI